MRRFPAFPNKEPAQGRRGADERWPQFSPIRRLGGEAKATTAARAARRQREFLAEAHGQAAARRRCGAGRRWRRSSAPRRPSRCRSTRHRVALRGQPAPAGRARDAVHDAPPDRGAPGGRRAAGSPQHRERGRHDRLRRVLLHQVAGRRHHLQPRSRDARGERLAALRPGSTPPRAPQRMETGQRISP